MKKQTLPVIITALLFLVAGCSKEKVYNENLEGTWGVYKYLWQNIEQTNQFIARYPSYSITFTNDGKFVEQFANPDTVIINGTYTFTDQLEKIELEHTAVKLVDTVEVPYQVKRKYTIFNLTRTHVQLRNDTSQLYMKKLEEE